MSEKLFFDSLKIEYVDEIVFAFKAIGWDKPRSIYENYLSEQLNGKRSVLVAKFNDKFCGYVTLKWVSDYSFFCHNGIPEISDLNVLPDYRNQGIGTKLIEKCEAMVSEKEQPIIGIGVGLTADYGNAQKLYVHLGYIPDGFGLHYRNEPIHYNDKVLVDDDLILYLTKTLSNK